jgi:hypothetical protein
LTLGIGNVDITLGGETVTLKPSLRAAQQLSRQAGGLTEAIGRVGRLDLDTIVSVIAIGSGKSDRKADVEAIGEKVFADGIASFVEPVALYLVILASGGKPPAGEESSDTENPPGA